MKLNKSIIVALSVLPLSLFAQEATDTIAPVNVEYEKAAFESSYLIDLQSDRVFSKGTFEFVMNHEFDLVSGDNDMIGIWGVANIRLGLSYAITDRITVGFGTSKQNRLQDFNLKAAIFKQTADGKMPLNVTYYGNAAYNATKDDFEYATDRWSFFNQLILSRRFSNSISILVSPSYSHYNRVESTMNNDMFSISVGGRAKVMPDLSIIFDSGVPLTSYEKNTPEVGFGLGLEYSSVGHAFQLFVTNYKGIVNQQNFMYTRNDFFAGDFQIGFNITKSW